MASFTDALGSSEASCERVNLSDGMSESPPSCFAMLLYSHASRHGDNVFTITIILGGSRVRLPKWVAN